MWMLREPLYRSIRDRIRADEAAVRPAAAALRADAAALVHDPGPAVTDKTFTPHSPTRDPHAYVSVATYYWPNPDTPDGLPYVPRDGRLSPDVHRYDRPRWDRAAGEMVTLVKAAWFLDGADFARAAAARVRRWFLDPETRMDAHLEHSQFVPGESTGRAFGIIEFALHLPVVLDHVRLLAGLEASPWTADDDRALRDWCAAFATWLAESDFGRVERAAANNHGTYYDRLAAHLALVLDRPDAARATLADTRARIGAQIEPDGSQPHELGRTCSFSYALMNARGFVELARMGRTLGVDLWGIDAGGGRSIPAAVDFLHRHAAGDAPWPYEQIEPIDWRMLWPVLATANDLGASCTFESIAHRLAPDETPERILLCEPIHPFGRERTPGA